MRIRSRILTKVIAAIGAALIRVLFRTCRVRVIEDFPGVSPYNDTGSRRHLYCIWHDQLVMAIFSRRPIKMAGLVSQHQDGSYLSDAMEMLGITPVRGSTNRGGGRAMREMIERTKDLHVAITPDGPRGPRHEMKPGIVFLASHSGRTIVPTAYACRRCWKIPGRWSDMMIPKPFTTVFARGGVPLQIPHELERSQLDHFQALLQAQMEQLEAEVEALARGENLPQSQPSNRAAA